MISTLMTATMFQSDIFPASYWITNPRNYITNNRAAGSDGFGIYYYLEKKTGTTISKCPSGLIIAESSNNVAHSN